MEVGHLRSKALSPEDVFRLLETARNSERHDTLKTYSSDYWYVLIGLGLYSGCRVGEACGRRWQDVDFEAGTLLIASKVSSETDEFEPFTKNFLGGHIGLAAPMLAALRRLHAEMKPKDEDFILGERSMRLSTSKERDWLSTRNLRDRYAVLTAAAWGTERENRNYHALRHTFATTMADAGVPLAQIQRAMRHAQLRQTMGYVHPRAGAVDMATKAIDYTPKLQVLPGGRKAKM
jgi:integrase